MRKKILQNNNYIDDLPCQKLHCKLGTALAAYDYFTSTFRKTFSPALQKKENKQAHTYLLTVCNTPQP